MHNIREKLIELLGDKLIFGRGILYEVADHLIANGVTIGKPLAQFLRPVFNYEGLKDKYLVFKVDTGELVVNCFVLRPEKDIAAVEALRAYARTTDNKTLSNDIYNWVGDGETVQKWIPVSDRQPDKEGSYLVYSSKSKTVFTAHYRPHIDRWANRANGQFITHWMPMPQPPKEDAQ